MDRNLYAPPAAAVADPVEVKAERPKEVTWAMNLIWAALVIGTAAGLLSMATTLFTASPFGTSATVAVVAIGVGVRIVITVWVNTRIALGRNWMRILLAVLFASGVVYFAVEWRAYANLLTGKAPLFFMATLVRSLLNVATMVLLFTPRANRWFKAMA